MFNDLQLGPWALLTAQYSPFLIPKERWDALEEHIQQVLAFSRTHPAELSNLFDASYFAQTQHWHSLTLPAMQGFAIFMKKYGRHVIPRVYGAFAEAIRKRDLAEVKQACDKILKAINKSMSRNEEVIAFLDDMTFIGKKLIALATIFELKGPESETDKNRLTPEEKEYLKLCKEIVLPPLYEFEDCRAVLFENRVGFTKIKRMLDEGATLDEPIFAELNLEQAIADWAKLANDAEAFVRFCEGR